MDDHQAKALLEHIDTAVAALRAEILGVCDDLVNRVQSADEHIAKLGQNLSTYSASEMITIESRDQTETISAQLTERERTIEAMSSHIADLEKTITELKNEVAQLHTQEAWTIATNQDLSERLVAALAGEKVRVKAQADSEARIQELTRALNEREETQKSLARQLETIRRERNEARQAVKRLSDEVTLLRRANTDLQVEGDTAKEQVTKFQKQQRITYESVLGATENMKVGEILVSAGLLTQKQLAEALGEQGTSGRMVGEILVNKGFVSEEDVAQTVACQLHLPFVHLADQTIRRDTARTIGQSTCNEYSCIPVQSTAERIFVAMANPRNQVAISRIEESSNRKVVPLVATNKDVMATISRVFSSLS